MNISRLLILCCTLGAVTILIAAKHGTALATDDTKSKSKTIEPFNGKDLTGWHAKGDPKRNQWTVGTASLSPDNPRHLKVTPGGNELINAGGHGLDFYSEAKFGDARVELEVMVPKGSNSGIYLMGEYEVQVLDSFGRKKMGGGDMGAIYGAAPPKVNASKPPGVWQKYAIEYLAPRFDKDGKKTQNARILKVTLNGQVIHKDVELKTLTNGGVTGKEAPTGPIMFQGNHGEVAYRCIKITPLTTK